MFLQGKMSSKTLGPWTTWPENHKHILTPKTMIKKCHRNVTKRWLILVSLFFTFTTSLTQRPRYSGSETHLRLPCLAPCKLLCYKHLLSEFGFQRLRHTSPCSITMWQPKGSSEASACGLLTLCQHRTFLLRIQQLPSHFGPGIWLGNSLLNRASAALGNISSLQ